MKSTLLFLLSLAFYCVSLGLPAISGGRDVLPGLSLLILGWIQAYDGECFAWLANIAYFTGVMLFLIKRYKAAVYAAAMACLIGFDTFRATQYSPNAAGYSVNIESIGSAFYVWELAFAVLALTAGLRASANNSFKPNSLRESA